MVFICFHCNDLEITPFFSFYTTATTSFQFLPLHNGFQLEGRKKICVHGDHAWRGNDEEASCALRSAPCFLPAARSPAILKTPTTVTSLCVHFTTCRALSVRGLRPWENSSRVKTENEFFKAKSVFLTDSRVTFVHKCNQDSSVPEPLQQEYIIHYQRICTESVVNTVPVHILRWETYKVILQTMNHKCRKSPGVPDHFASANDLLNCIQAGNRLYFVKPVKQGHTLLNCTGPTSNALPTEARKLIINR